MITKVDLFTCVEDVFVSQNIANAMLPAGFRVLVACEESQTVCKAFRNIGVDAYSCDIQDCSGGKPEWHIKGDAIKEAYSGKYDLMIAHPPCTYLTNSGVTWLHRQPGRWQLMRDGAEFFKTLLDAPIPLIAVENPIMHKYDVEIIGSPAIIASMIWTGNPSRQLADTDKSEAIRSCGISLRYPSK